MILHRCRQPSSLLCLRVSLQCGEGIAHFSQSFSSSVEWKFQVFLSNLVLNIFSKRLWHSGQRFFPQVSREAVLPLFNEMFSAISCVVADPDQNVKNGSELLDRLLKDIVTESKAFDVESFVPALRERMYTRDRYTGIDPPRLTLSRALYVILCHFPKMQLFYFSLFPKPQQYLLWWTVLTMGWKLKMYCDSNAL